MLSIQYILGIGINLFVKFPDSGSAKDYWDFANSQLLVVTHIIVAVLLSIGSITLLIRSIRNKNQKFILISGIGLVSILVAGFSGSKYVPTQNDIYSFIMAIGFITAFLSYITGLFFV